MAKKQQQETQAASGGLRALVFLGLALIAGAAATIMVYQLVVGYQQKIEEAKRPEETVVAIVAATDLYPGLPITEEDIVGITMPKKYVHPDALAEAELVVGRIPRERILTNEFVLPERLADGATGVGLNALVPPGMRAISLNISNGDALSGFLNPGNIVDVVVTIAGDGKDGTDTRRQTFTLLQTISVLAVDSRMLSNGEPDPEADKKAKGGAKKKKRTADRKSAPSVTLAVTPEQAEQVAHAEKRGQLLLTLRNDVDWEHVASAGATADDVLGYKEEPKKPTPRKAPAAPKTTGLLIIKGQSTTERQVNPDGTLR